MRRVILTTAGYLLLVLGFIGIILNFIGLSLWPLSLVEKMTSAAIMFLVEIGMILAGFILFYMSRINPEQE